MSATMRASVRGEAMRPVMRVLRTGDGTFVSRSSAEHSHRSGGVAVADGDALGRDLVDALEVGARERDVHCADILLEIAAALGSGNRDHVIALRQHPRQREL